MAAPFDITSYPHRSLAGRGFGVLLAVVAGWNFLGAALCVALGAWPVAGFMGLDVLAVYVAFRMSYAQSRACERICIEGGQIIVERLDQHGRGQSWSFPAYWAHVVHDGENDVYLRSHGKSVAVGTHLSRFEREAFALMLREALLAAKSVDAGT